MRNEELTPENIEKTLKNIWKTEEECKDIEFDWVYFRKRFEAMLKREECNEIFRPRND